LEPAGVPGDIAVWSERFADAEHLFTGLLRSAEQRNDPFALFHAAFSWTDGLCRLGRLEEAFVLSERVFEVAEVAPMVRPFAVASRAMVLLEQGRLDEASRWTDQLASLATGHRWFLVVGYDLHRRGTLAWRSGQLEEACAIFEQLEERADVWGLRDPSTVPWAADAMSAYRACNRPDDVERVVERLAHAHELPGLWPRVVASRGRAALAEYRGNVDQAEHHYLQAVMLQSTMQLPLARAETLTEFGGFLVRRGDFTRARQVLGDAMHLGEEHGARWHADRARAEWRRAGGRTRRTAPGALTPQETAVAALVRAGRTNRQIAQQLFLSENTVETHLAHVYRKLGIRRRWELIARGDESMLGSSQGEET
jgi:DNA-binding NarL/FixJ family response regulator